MPEYQEGTARAPIFLFPPETEIPFYIDDAKERISNNGNTCIKLKLNCYDFTHKKWVGPIWSTLTFVESAYWQIDAFRAATGEVIRKGEQANLEAEDCVGRRGWCILDVWESENREIKINVVRKWVKRRPKTDLPTPTSTQAHKPPARAAQAAVPAQAEPDWDVDPDNPEPPESAGEIPY